MYTEITKKTRLNPLCVCGKPKTAGEDCQIVCWGCWYDGFNGLGHEPFKYFQGDYSEWLRKLKSLNLL